MQLKVIKGDLFSLETKYSLVHCVSLDCAMGAGIAKEFVKRYPIMKPYVKKQVREKNLTTPTMVPFYIFSEKRYIFNLITKDKYYQKPTYDTLKLSLEELKKECVKNDIKYLGMPTIGSGLDKLSWQKVEEIIKDVFKNIDINIIVNFL